MIKATGRRGVFLGIRAAGAASPEVLQHDGIANRPKHWCDARFSGQRYATRFGPETDAALQPNKGPIKKQEQRRDHHCGIRHDSVERPWALVRYKQPVPRNKDERRDVHGYRRYASQKHAPAALRKRPPQKSWPAPIFVALHARVRHSFRNVDGKLVRLRVHARLIAGATVMTKVSQVPNVAVGEAPSQFKRRENCAKTFAIAARIADGQLTIRLLEKINFGHWLPRPRRQVRRMPPQPPAQTNLRIFRQGFLRT